MTTLPKRVLYYGRDEPLPEQRRLRAGSITLVYEAGDLRYLRAGGREVLRRVYAAVRDRNWGTLPNVLANERVETGPDWFRITYDVQNREGEIDFRWSAAITGEPDGTIRFSMEGEAHSTFLRNRLGFCVLHPMRECAGAPARVEHPDGSTEEGTFPEEISPDQPFLEIQAIAHEVAPGLWAEVRFEGDIFEMEDQRNWTDASFKTYCTPLRLPFPAEVPRGTRISQSVTIRLIGPVGPISRLEAAAAENAVTLALGEPVGRLPEIGLGAASHGEPLTPREIERLRALRLSHLRVDLDPSAPELPETLRRAAAEARELGATLELAIHLSDSAGEELDRLVGLLDRLRPSVRRWLVFHRAEKSTSERWARPARERLRSWDAKAVIGGGTNANFTELNRGRPPVEVLDFVCYSINPQVHAFDNVSLIETLEAQGATVESARRFSGGLPLAISPVTLKPRFNPDATGADEPAPGELPPQVDPRQWSLFGAGWTLGCVKALAESGVGSVTLYETTGWRGVMERDSGSPLPELFPSLPGAVFPLYHVLADLGELRGAEVIEAISTDPLRVTALALRTEGRTVVLAANLGPEPVTVRLSLPWESASLRRLDETNALDAMTAPEAYRARAGEVLEPLDGTFALELLPCAVMRLDGSPARMPALRDRP